MRTTFNSKLAISTLLWLILSLILLGCADGENDTLENEVDESPIGMVISRAQFKAADLELGTIKKVIFYSEVRATGILDVPPSRRAELNVSFGGYVKEVDLLPGDVVKKGDVLFVLEDPIYLEIQSEFLQSRDALKYLKNDFERQKALRIDSISSEKKYLKSEEVYQSALSRYQSLREKVKLLNIDPDQLSATSISSLRKVKAPISGTVSEMHLNLGSYIKPSEKAICIINTEHMHVELKVFEKDLKEIKEGQSILFTLQNDSKRKYTAEVHLINRQIDPDERSLQLHGHLAEDSTYEDLYPGMYVEAKILTASDTLESLPSQAIVEKNGRYYAALIKEENEDQMVLEEIEILPLKMNDDYVAIKNLSDIPKNARFIVKGAFKLIRE